MSRVESPNDNGPALGRQRGEASQRRGALGVGSIRSRADLPEQPQEFHASRAGTPTTKAPLWSRRRARPPAGADRWAPIPTNRPIDGASSVPSPRQRTGLAPCVGEEGSEAQAGAGVLNQGVTKKAHRLARPTPGDGASSPIAATSRNDKGPASGNKVRPSTGSDLCSLPANPARFTRSV
jgi:hypothetical protein